MLAGFANAFKGFLRRDKAQPEDAEALAWLMAPLLFLVALWLRLMLPPMGFMHENAHGYLLFNDIGFLEPYRDVYGLGYFALHAPFRLIFGAKFASLFGVQAVLSALLPALAFMISWRGLGWSFAAAASAGSAVALHPVLIRFGLSETMFTPAIFFWMASLYYLLAWGRRDTPWRLAAAVSAGILATQIRPEMYGIVPVTVVTAVVCNDTLKHRINISWLNASPASQRRHLLWAMGLTVVLLALPLHNFIWRLLNGEQQSAHLVGFDPLLLGRLALNIHLNPWEGGDVPFARAFTPLIVSVAAAAGGIILVTKTRLRSLTLLVPLTVMTVIWLPVQTAPMVAARLQQPLVVIWCMIAGYAVGTGIDALRARGLMRPAMVTAVVWVAALGLGLQARHQLVAHQWSPQREFAFLQEALPKLPDDAVIIVPQGDHVVNSAFPAAAATLQGRGIATVSINDYRSSRRPAYFYLGLPCWSFKSLESLRKNGPLRRECRDMISRNTGGPPPGLSAKIPADSNDFLHVPAGMLRLGFIPVH